jgi:hypothetical protein
MQRKCTAEMYIKRLQDTATNIKGDQWKQAYVHTSFPKCISSLMTRDGLKKLAFTQIHNFIIEIIRRQYEKEAAYISLLPAVFQWQFRRFRKTTKGEYYLRHVCPSVRMQLASHWTDSMKFDISIFRNYDEKVKVSSESDKNNRYFT